MRKFRMPRPSAALVVASLALFVALGGGAYAAFKLPKNSVGTKQIKNSAVTNSKLANGAVGTGKIKNGAVTSSKLNTSGLTVPNATFANSAGSATNATNASNANAVDGQTLVGVNANVGENGSQVVYNANGVTVTVNCSSSGLPTIEVNAPSQAELNWSSNDDGTVNGGTDDNVNNSADDVTSGQSRGNGTFALSTNAPGHTLTGNLSWDDTPTHGSTFTGCSVWGTLIAS